MNISLRVDACTSPRDAPYLIDKANVNVSQLASMHIFSCFLVHDHRLYD
jgi:hypothetical protein